MGSKLLTHTPLGDTTQVLPGEGIIVLVKTVQCGMLEKRKIRNRFKQKLLTDFFQSCKGNSTGKGQNVFNKWKRKFTWKTIFFYI